MGLPGKRAVPARREMGTFGEQAEAERLRSESTCVPLGSKCEHGDGFIPVCKLIKVNAAELSASMSPDDCTCITCCSVPCRH
jgi:hypothetical protein